jgi:molybdenum cofactor cytidylyltransferase
MIECVIDAFATPVVAEIIVVLGYRGESIVARLEPRPPRVRPVTNPAWKTGMFSSVQAGLRVLPAETKLVLLGLCDQPRLQPATVETLVRDFTGQIMVPTIHGRQGHPLLFAARYVPEILAMDETLTLKHFLANHPKEIARSPVNDEGVLIDIDDRADYDREMRV